MPNVVGKSLPRFDAFEKVTGKARYIDDICYPDLLFGIVVRATIPRGRVRTITLDPSFDWSKVTIADHNDIPGKNIVTLIKDDQQFLVEDVVNHAGEAVLLIAAETKELAEEARKYVKVQYEEFPAVFTIEEARSKKAIIYNDNNEICRYNVEKGDLDGALEKADHVIEGEYRTGYHEHAYLEPQGMVAIPRKDGGFTLQGSLQCPYYVLKAMKTLLGVDADKVNVRQALMGGAFGGKEDYPSLLAGYCVLLAKKSGRPVKMVYDRNEDILYTTKRHPSIVRHKTAVKKDGTLLGMEIDVAFDGGAYTTLSPVVLARGLLHAWGPYRCPSVRATAVCYATNTVSTGAFRGFGAPQTLFAIESHMDVIAERLKMSPLEIRRKNCLKVGDETATGQILKESVGAMECLEKAAASSKFKEKFCQQSQQGKKGQQRKGVGISLFMHGAGFTGGGEAIMKSKAAIRLEKNGNVTILTGCTDMGQGSHSVLPQIVADGLGLPVANVRCEAPDTAIVPDSGPTVASRTTMVIGKVLLWCCEELKKRISVSAHRRISAKDYIKKNAGAIIEKHYELPSGIKWDHEKFHGDAYPTFAWGCNVAEVSVDAETMEVTVDKMHIVYDVGKAINPQSVEGQLEGGTLQAMGYAVLEEMKYDKGLPLNNRFQTYIIPTAKDAPEFKTMIVEDNFSWGPFGAKGLGELPLDGGAPAIANAIYNACGVRMTDLPITAEKIIKAMANVK
ncbi:MAG: aldehyde oxidase [Deltaproteobacteria bacterium CG11_big_fil_rev_8_21_14_0_20_49_13]|nr:MAG: aldehyde oxidase [Deltaproteobacteria bacterium CG11_big_fil_rev_8_21_14_0_20_49_13]